MKTDTDDMVTVESGGSSIVKHKPLFSLDSKYLLCPCGNIIKVFSISTGYCYRRLCGHSLDVTSVQNHPKNKLQVLSSSLDGNVNIWDYEDGVLLSSIKFNHPLTAIFCHKMFPSMGFVVQNQDESFELVKFSLDKSLSEEEESDTPNQVIAKSLPKDVNNRFAFSGNFMAVAFHRKAVVYKELYTVKPKKKCKKVVLDVCFDQDPNITCIASHPIEAIVATGHYNGEIRVWYNIFENTPIMNKQHWHSLEVLSLSFTPRGSSLLSGGHECVLVQWSDEKKHFLPRLGSPISRITVANDNTLYACCHADNSITIISSYFTIKQTFEGFAAANSDLSCGLQYDKRSDACITNGKPGHLLFYHAATDTQLYNLDVIGQNFISSADLEMPLSQTKICKIAFSTSNRYVMATMEFNTENKCDQKLKFWDFNESEQQWGLNTVVSSPHSNEVVTSLIFHPQENMCASTSKDGTCKIWYLDESKWICDSCITHRGEPCHNASFSEDGSMLALAFGSSVLLCDPQKPDELMLLMSQSETIRSLEFGRKSCSHHLMVLAANLQCWNILSGTLSWSNDSQDSKMLVADNFSSNMALFTKSNSVFIFSPDQNLPKFAYDLEFQPVAACFVPSSTGCASWGNGSQIYMISDKMTVHTFAAKNQPKDKENTVLTSQSDAVNPVSSILSSKTADLEDKTVENLSIQPKTKQEALSFMFETPTHILPPMKTICQQFISTLLLNGTGTKPDTVASKDLREHSLDEPTSDVMETENGEYKLSVKPEELRPDDFEFLVPVLGDLFVNK
uniref:WD repeat-containing protein 75 n=1 Tax=Phallusia mammillata TaxID=59560 RepID=A0A6F9DXN0_9ASCI|nr:WD repeat-containing protein 75 [Phallusia mammillata]